jgi:hypothetical protein
MAVVTIPYSPRNHQVEMHRQIESHRFACIVAHRRFGKTVAVVNHLVKMAATCTLPEPRCAYIAPLYAQAKSVAWDYLRRYTAPIPGVVKNESELWVQLPNNGRVRLFGADNPDALRGMYFDCVVLDEVAQMKPIVWGEIIRPAIADRGGSAVFIGTPKGRNLFSDIYQEAIRDSKWWVGMYRASETGVLPESELEEARRQMSPNQYAQEFECAFDVSSSKQFIASEIVDEAIRRVVAERDVLHAPVILSLDPAWSGDDEYVIGMRRGLHFEILWTGYKIEDDVWLAKILAQFEDKHQAAAVFIDFGYGTGVASVGKSWGRKWRLVSFGGASTDPQWQNKRTEMWALALQWMRDGGSLPDDPILRADMVGPEYDVKLDGRVGLEGKEQMKKRGIPSPNRGDALALTFAAPVRRVENLPRVRQTKDPLGYFTRSAHG